MRGLGVLRGISVEDVEIPLPNARDRCPSSLVRTNCRACVAPIILTTFFRTLHAHRRRKNSATASFPSVTEVVLSPPSRAEVLPLAIKPSSQDRHRIARTQRHEQPNASDDLPQERPNKSRRRFGFSQSPRLRECGSVRAEDIPALPTLRISCGKQVAVFAQSGFRQVGNLLQARTTSLAYVHAMPPSIPPSGEHPPRKTRPVTYRQQSGNVSIGEGGEFFRKSADFEKAGPAKDRRIAGEPRIIIHQRSCRPGVDKARLGKRHRRVQARDPSARRINDIGAR